MASLQTLSVKTNYKVLIVLLLLTTFHKFTSANYSESDISEDTEPDPELEAYLREAIENFRELMKVGIPAIHMPVLDPLELRNLDVNVNENVAIMDLMIKESAIEGLSSFELLELKPNLEEFYLHINFSLPEAYVNGNYNISGKFVRIFPIYGQGRYAINATDVYIAGMGQLEFTTDTLQLGMLKLDLDWKKITMKLENFMKDDDFSRVLQEIIPGVGKDIFRLYKPTVLGLLETAITEKINDQLNQPEVKEIIRSLIPSY